MPCFAASSQSNITALPAILRGKKVLIVGDDKQVSPTVVGIEERQIIQLRETYLKGHPLRDQLEPSTSLYERLNGFRLRVGRPD